MSFAGKVILITGAGSGIGADAARHLAKLGAKVALVDLNEMGISAVADEIKQSGSALPLTIAADVTKDAARITNETIKHFGLLDVLINCAGVVNKDNVVDAELSEFDRVFDVNVRAVMNLTKLCVPHLEKTKGNVVNVSSVAGLKVTQNFMSYCMSKAALDQFTKCSALDLAAKGIRVNSINPAFIRTPIYETAGMTPESIEAFFTLIKNKFPLGRIGEVSDTSAAISFLADNNLASFLTGVLLTVDGGSMVGLRDS